MLSDATRTRLNNVNLQLENHLDGEKHGFSICRAKNPGLEILTWQDWANFLYAVRNVSAHGSAARTLVRGCCPQLLRQRIRSVLSNMNLSPVNRSQEKWSMNMLFLLTDIEARIDLQYRTAVVAGTNLPQDTAHQEKALSFAVILWLPKMMRALMLTMHTNGIRTDYGSNAMNEEYNLFGN
jgi:hypothetical protein